MILTDVFLILGCLAVFGLCQRSDVKAARRKRLWKQIFKQGYVYAPYIPFYTTPTVVLDDFKAKKGMATQWGKRKVNGRFYSSGKVTA